MSLEEWHKVWSVQTLYPLDLKGMQEAIDNLTCRRDWVCYRAANEVEVYNGVSHRKSAVGSWDDVVGFIKLMADEAGVVLAER